MELEENKQQHYEPTSMLVVYTSINKSYLESHQIINGKPQNGKPISIETVNALRSAMGNLDGSDMKSLKGAIPEELIYMDTDPVNPILIWWSDYRHRKLYFKKDLNMPKKLYHIPVMVWVLKKNELSVYVMEVLNSRYHNPKNIIYPAPFPNVHEDDTVCMGNVKVNCDSDDISTILKFTENSFFNSEFNTIHHPESCKQDIYVFWKDSELFDYKQCTEHSNYKNLKELVDDNKN